MQHNLVLEHIRGAGKRLVITGGIFLVIGLFCMKSITAVMGSADNGQFRMLVLFIAPIPLLALFSAGLGLFCLLRPEAHPSLVALEAASPGARARLYSELREPARLQMKHAAGLKQGPPGGVIFSDSFILTLSLWGLQARSLADLAWVHREQKEVHHNGVLIETTHLLQLHFLGQKPLPLGFRDSHQREEMMSYVVSKRPGVVTGYSEELRELWAKDRRAFASLARAG